MKNTHKEIVALAAPALLTLAVDPLVSMVDTAFVSQLGTLHLGALGVNSAIFFVAFFIANFLSYGTTPLVSEALGLDRNEEARRLSSEAFIVASILGTAVVFGLVLGRVTWLEMMGAGEERLLLLEAESYLLIRAFAAPAVFLITAGNGIFRGYGNTRTPLYITLLLNVVNVVLDAVLILGFGLGLVGAAVATLCAQWCGALLFLLLLLKKKRLVWVVQPRFGLFFQLGWMLGLRTLSLVGTLAVATSAATRLGTETVAAHQVVLQVWLLWALVIDSIAVSAQIMVPRTLAVRDFKGLRSLIRRLWGWGVLAGCVLAAATVVSIPILPGMFSTDAAVIDQIRGALFVLIPLQPLGGVVFVGDGIFLGAKRFGFLAASCAAGGVLSCLALLFFCDNLVEIWIILLGFVGFRAAAMGVEVVRTRGRLVGSSPSELVVANESE